MTTNKASGGDGTPAELFQILNDGSVKVLHSICRQIWKTQQWPQDWKRSVFIPVPKTAMSSLVAQMVKNRPAVQETLVQSLGRKVLLEKEMATHSSILAWRILCIQEPGGLQSMELQRVGHD